MTRAILPLVSTGGVALRIGRRRPNAPSHQTNRSTSKSLADLRGDCHGPRRTSDYLPFLSSETPSWMSCDPVEASGCPSRSPTLAVDGAAHDMTAEDIVQRGLEELVEPAGPKFPGIQPFIPFSGRTTGHAVHRRPDPHIVRNGRDYSAARLVVTLVAS